MDNCKIVLDKVNAALRLSLTVSKLVVLGVPLDMMVDLFNDMAILAKPSDPLVPNVSAYTAGTNNTTDADEASDNNTGADKAHNNTDANNASNN